MKRKLFFLTALVIGQVSHGQMVAEDAKGQNTVLYKNASLAFNLTEAQLSATMNNFSKLHLAERPKLFLWQLEATGKNEEGLGGLWNEGNLQAAARIGGTIGMRFRAYRVEYALYGQLDALSKHKDLVAYQTKLDYKKELLLRVTGDVSLNPAEKRDLTDALTASLQKNLFVIKGVISDAEDLADKYKNAGKGALEKASNGVIQFLKQREQEINKIKGNADKIRAQMDDVNRQLDNFRSTHPHRAFTFYVNAGMNAGDYTLFARPTATPFVTRFDTTNFRGGFVNVGINYDAGARWVLGLSFGYEKANTFDTLTKKDYIERNTETTAPQSFISEKKYIAYSGFYTVYDRYTLMTDLLYFGKIHEAYRFVWNVLFSRFHLPYNVERVKPIVTLGSSINFYKKKGRFVGGLYLQERDVANRLEKENSDFWHRISLGVTTKFSFDAILDR